MVIFVRKNEEKFEKLIIQSIKEALDEIPNPPYSKEKNWEIICKQLNALGKSCEMK